MNDKISHSGIIEKVSPSCVTVRITQSAACASCSVARHCNASETKVKIVEVKNCKDWKTYSSGQTVMISASRHVVGIALTLGFVMPLLIMLAVITAVYFKTQDEPIAALSGLGALIPYYIILAVLRNKISAKVSFNIEKII